MRCFEVLWIRQEISFPCISSSSHHDAKPLSYFCHLACYFYLLECVRPLKTNTASVSSLIPSSRLSALPPGGCCCRRLHKAPACGCWVADGNLLSLQRSCHRRRHTSHCLPQPCLGGDQELLHSANTDGGFSFFCFLITTQLLYFFYQGVAHK